MPRWGEILSELEETKTPDGAPDFDGVRRKYLSQCHEHTKRNTILFASAWIQKPELGSRVIIAEEDVQALMEAVHGLRGKKLDLIMHSPGGRAEAAEGIVLYLRSKFSDIRVIVPHMAMSAATMISCAADRIVMSKHSFLGPTDPQFELDNRVVAAHNLLDEFDRARKECAKDPMNMLAWKPILDQYKPGLLTRCEVARDLSDQLVAQWLSEYMLRGKSDRETKAKKMSDWLSEH